MNIESIYALDVDPRKAASNHVDVHVAKALVECAYLLSAAHVYLDTETVARQRVAGLMQTRSCTGVWAQWVRASEGNYQWMHLFMGEMLRQFELRYGRIHGYEGPWYGLATLPRNIPMEFMSRFPRFGKELFTNVDIVLEARNYYFKNMAMVAQWTVPARVPFWWKAMIEQSKVQRA